MKPFFLLSALLCSLGLAAQSAATPDSLGVPHALPWFLEQGLLHNYAIHIADNRQQTAAENATRANAGMLPSVTASAGYGADLSSSRSADRTTGAVTTSTNYLDHAVQAQAGLTWTVFDGFGMQARYAELQLLRQQGDLDRRIAAEDLISSITAEYYNCIQQRIRLRNYRHAVRLSRERMRIVEARYNVGNFSRLDYMQAKVDFNADSAQYMKQQEALRSSVIELGRLVNLPSTASESQGIQPAAASYASLRIADTLIAVLPVLDYDQLWQDVLAYNTDLQHTSLSADLAAQTLRRVLARNYPSVKLNATYGYNHNRYDVVASRWTSHWGPSAGVTVGFDLYDPTRRSARNAARRDVETARLQHEDLQLALRARFRTLQQSHTNNLQMLALEEQNLTAAQENYDIARERYLLGDLSGFEMREAQQSLLYAEERILQAAYDTKMCEISLLLISGGIEKYLGSPAPSAAGK
ncbi:MAG: TolC family protein [Bacteroidaceae bacterium]|nr:TolC family protein [Bacteroidaceae bacterium]